MALQLSLSQAKAVLCLGAHADDIEIGCGGTLLTLLNARPELSVDWVVFSTTPERRQEALQSFQVWCGSFPNCKLHTFAFEDTLFPVQLREIKGTVAKLAKEVSPDLIFTHRLEDAHQDHRTIAEVTWNAFRDHLILEYEIPKYEGDLGRPNVYMPIDSMLAERKLSLLMGEFESQREKVWYEAATFRSLMQLRSIECRSPSGYAEAFHARKICLS